MMYVPKYNPIHRTVDTGEGQFAISTSKSLEIYYFELEKDILERTMSVYLNVVCRMQT